MLYSEDPLVRANVIAVVAPPTGHYQMPSKGGIRDRQGAVARGQVDAATPLGTVTRGEDALYRVSYQWRMVLWVPEEERELQAQLMVCAQLQDAGHRGVRATIPSPRSTLCLGQRGEGYSEIYPPMSKLHPFQSGQCYATSAGRSSARYGGG